MRPRGVHGERCERTHRRRTRGGVALSCLSAGHVCIARQPRPTGPQRSAANDRVCWRPMETLAHVRSPFPVYNMVVAVCTCGLWRYAIRICIHRNHGTCTTRPRIKLNQRSKQATVGGGHGGRARVKKLSSVSPGGCPFFCVFPPFASSSGGREGSLPIRVGMRRGVAWYTEHGCLVVI